MFNLSGTANPSSLKSALSTIYLLPIMFCFCFLAQSPLKRLLFMLSIMRGTKMQASTVDIDKKQMSNELSGDRPLSDINIHKPLEVAC